VFDQPVSGSRQGVLLAMAAALGAVVALLLVASMTSTRAQPARRKQLRTISAGTQPQAAAPARDQPGLLDEWFGRYAPLGDLDQPVR
jgi:hypothetical protein